ncbi:MAG: hypothetical protein J5J00_15855 [Deltaproteobacteria bacterium]|nr:hypothetical protein [Deltaproteobacteria bacterium]
MKRLFPAFFIAVLYGGAVLAQYQDTSQTEWSSPEVNITNNTEASFKMNDNVAAYNSINHEYLLVWQEQPDGTNPQRIYAARVSAFDGKVLKSRFLVSLPDGRGDGVDSRDADVAYDPINNRYLVVWAMRSANRAKIVGQFLEGTTAEKYGDPFIIGNGFEEDPLVEHYLVEGSRLIYNETLQEFLVTWGGTAAYAPFKKEVEIFAAKISPSGAVGPNVRISYFGPDADALYKVHSPDVAYNSRVGEYLFIWGTFIHGGDSKSLYFQRAAGSNLARLTEDNGLLIEASDAGYAGHVTRHGRIVYNAQTDEYYFVLSNNWNITGFRLRSADAKFMSRAELNTSGGRAESEPESVPGIIVRPGFSQYLVFWQGVRRTESNKSPHTYVYGQLVDAVSGQRMGPYNFRITQIASNSSRPISIPSTNAPAVAFDKDGNGLVAFLGSDHVKNVGIVHNLYSKVFRPYIEPVEFPPDGEGGENGKGTAPSKLYASVAVSKGKGGTYTAKGSCALENGPASVIAFDLRFYLSQDRTFDKATDKLKAIKRPKPGKNKANLKIKKFTKGAKYVVLECSVRDSSGQSSIAPSTAAARMQKGTIKMPSHQAHR